MELFSEKGDDDHRVNDDSGGPRRRHFTVNLGRFTVLGVVRSYTSQDVESVTFPTLGLYPSVSCTKGLGLSTEGHRRLCLSLQWGRCVVVSTTCERTLDPCPGEVDDDSDDYVDPRSRTR